MTCSSPSSLLLESLRSLFNLFSLFKGDGEDLALFGVLLLEEAAKLFLLGLGLREEEEDRLDKLERLRKELEDEDNEELLDRLVVLGDEVR